MDKYAYVRVVGIEYMGHISVLLFLLALSIPFLFPCLFSHLPPRGFVLTEAVCTQRQPRRLEEGRHAAENGRE